jgi:hypothetical protein
MAKKNEIVAAAPGAAVVAPEPLPAAATGPVKDGFARVEILVDTAVGAERVRAGQVLDVPIFDASHLVVIGKAKLVEA